MTRSGRIALRVGIALGLALGLAPTNSRSLGPPRAWAAEEAAPRARASGEVAGEVVVEIAAGDARESDAIAQVARELLGRLAVEVRAVQVPRLDLAVIAAPPRALGVGAAPLARVWIDLKTAGRATLYLLDARHDRLLVRQVERPVGGEELAREELGHILETACEGLLSGGEVGLPRAGVAPLLVPPPSRAPVAQAVSSAPTPAEGEAPRRWQVALLYEAAALASEAPLTHGPLASLFLAARARRPRWGLWTTAQLRVPVHAADQNVGVALETGALRALVALERHLSPRSTVRAGVGGGVDLVHATPEATAPERAVLAGSRTLAFAVGRAALALELRLSERTSLVATLATDVDLTGQRYVFSRASGEQLVLRPWAVRPAAAVGFAFP